MFRKRKFVGCYMLPVGMSMKLTRSTILFRLISLTPNVVSTNFVLELAINDLHNAATNEIGNLDSNGELCALFAEVVGLVVYYPSSSSVVDFLIHAAHYRCSRCSFRILEGSEMDMWK